jgi:hypothetical protein
MLSQHKKHRPESILSYTRNTDQNPYFHTKETKKASINVSHTRNTGQNPYFHTKE